MWFRLVLVTAALAAARPDPPAKISAPAPEVTTPLAAAADSNELQHNEMEPRAPVNEMFPAAVLYGRTCGGTIISPTWVITAAHCTLFSNGGTVLAGTNNTLDGSGVKVRVKRLVIHPLFSVGPYWLNANRYKINQVAAHYDFLLVELEKPLPLNGKTLAAARLHESTDTPVGLPVGYAGYGAEHHGETMRHDMHGMELTVQPDETCQRKLEQYDSKDMLCTKGRPPRLDSACNGDSGSGLISEGKLLGIASWVEKDSHECFPGALVVFSRVARVRKWIQDVTGI